MKTSSFLWLTRRDLPLWFVLFIGTALSSLVYQMKREAVTERQRAMFSEASNEYVRRFQWELEVHVDVLRSLRDVMLAWPEAGRRAFHSCSKAGMERAFAMRSFQWIAVVPGDQLERFEREAVEEGFGQFAVFSYDEQGRRVKAKPTARHYPLLYIQPRAEHQEFFGFDFGSVEKIQQAFQVAERSRSLVVVSGQSLQGPVQDHELLMLFPVFAAEESSGEIVGFVSSRLDIEAICARVFRSKINGMRVEVVDKAVDGPGSTLLYSRGSVSEGASVSRLNAPIWFNNLEWELRIATEGETSAPGGNAESWSVLGLGLLMTCFLALWVRQRQVYLETVEIKVSERTGALSQINDNLQNEMAQRKRAESGLQESEARFREAFLHAPIGVALLSPGGMWIQVNEALTDMTGFSEDELLKKKMADMLHPEEVLDELAKMGQLLAGEVETFALEQRFRHKSGDFIWVLMNVSQIRNEDGWLLYFVCQILDITGRKQAMEQTRRAQRFSENIINSSIDGILAFDRAGEVTVWSSGMEKMTAVRAKEAVGRPAGEVLPFLATEMDQEYGLQRVLERKEVRSVERPFLVPSSGRNGFYTANMAPLIDETGEIGGGVAIIHDVTKEREIRERLSDFAEKLRQRNRELQDFAYVASHDLQEPLRKIRAFGDRLEKRSEGKLDDQGMDYLARMQDAASRMQTLISDLLAFSRIATEANPFVPVNLENVVREVLSDLETQIEETAAEIDVGSLPTVEGDPTQMRQLMQNLVSNGLKYHRAEGPCRLRIYATEAKEGNGFPPLGAPGCLLHVEDNGIGFDEKYLDRIFTVFQRLHGRNEYAGTGIGLAVCRRIVERHQGWITARSVPGEGSTFITALPLVQSETSE